MNINYTQPNGEEFSSAYIFGIVTVFCWHANYLHQTHSTSDPRHFHFELYKAFYWLAICIASTFFWDITQRGMLVSYRRFGITYRSHLRVSSNLLVLHDPWRWGRQVVPKRRQWIATIGIVKIQMNADLIYTAALAWSRAKNHPFGFKFFQMANLTS